MTSDLSEILSKTQDGLQTRNGSLPASFYKVNTAHWSFSVARTDTLLRYAAFRAVASRFVKLASTTVAPEDIIFTRVGVILNNKIPLADIVILLYQSVSDSPPLSKSAIQILLHRYPVNLEVTPYGSTYIYQVVKETMALAPFRRDDSSTTRHDLQPRSLETVMLASLTHTVLYYCHVTYRLWREPIRHVAVLVARDVIDAANIKLISCPVIFFSPRTNLHSKD